MNALMRPTLYGADHCIHNLARIEEATDAAFDVVGPICESGGVFGAGRMLRAATGEGDVVLVADAGADGFVMANSYNLRALPREDVLELPRASALPGRAQRWPACWRCWHT